MSGWNLKDFAINKGMTEKTLFEKVKSILPLENNDIVVISGSLVEGIGTYTSDLDVFVIGTPRESGDFGELNILDASGIPVDLSFVPIKRLEYLVNLLSELPSNQDRDPRTALRISPADRDLLHRILISIPLINKEKFEGLRSQINGKSLSRLLVDRAIVRVGTAHQDLLGLIQQNDYSTCILLHQIIVGFTMDALLGALGNTNPGEKWRFRLLKKYKEEDTQFLPLNINSNSIVEEFIKVFCISNSNDQTVREYLYKSVKIANIILPWARMQFLGEPWSTTKDRERPGDALLKPILNKITYSTLKLSKISHLKPIVRISTQIRLENEKMIVRSLLNGSLIEINKESFEFLAHLNGEDTIHDIIHKLNLEGSKYSQGIGDLIEYMVYRKYIEI